MFTEAAVSISSTQHTDRIMGNYVEYMDITYVKKYNQPLTFNSITASTLLVIIIQVSLDNT